MDISMAYVNPENVEYQLPSATARLVVKTSAELEIRLTIYQGREEFLKRYSQGEKLGGGGFGNVYTGVRLEDSRPTVIKEVNTNKVPCWCALDGVLVPIEIVLLQMCQRISGVVRMLDVFNLDQTWIIVMNGADSSVCDMFDYICDRKTLTEPEAAFFMHQLIGILIQCHKCGVLHRDVKDENLLIDRKTNEITLIDFGSGAFLHENLYTDFDGTRVYSPCEWITQGQYYGKRAEAWSLGVLLYDMLCGDVPFVNDKGIISGRLKYRRDGLGEDAKHLISACMNREDSQRITLLEILRHPWMQRHRPKITNSLPMPILVALEELSCSRTTHASIHTSSSIPCTSSMKSGICDLVSAPIDVPAGRVHGFRACSITCNSPTSLTNPSASPISFLGKNDDLYSSAAIDLSTSHRGCPFRQPQENIQLPELRNSNDATTFSRAHSNRSYASSGYYSRSNSLSSDEDKKRAGGAFVVANTKMEVHPLWVGSPRDWREKAANDSSSSSSTSSTFSDRVSQKNNKFHPPTSVSPAFHPAIGDNRPLQSSHSFSTTSVSCNNLQALRCSSNHGGFKNYFTPPEEHVALDIPDATSLWFRCLEPLGAPERQRPLEDGITDVNTPLVGGLQQHMYSMLYQSNGDT